MWSSYMYDHTGDSIEHVLINAEPMAICDHAHGVDCLWVWLDGSLSILAQQDAFEKGEWGKMNARDRGALMLQVREELQVHTHCMLHVQ